MNDTISRKTAIDALCKVGCGSGYCGISCDDVKAIEQLPSTQPVIRTQMSSADCISRHEAIKAVSEACFELRGVFGRCEDALKALPSAQPEYKMDEWCTDCKEYDRERHCCPRFNRVIRETLEEIQPMRKFLKNEEEDDFTQWYEHHFRMSEDC